MPDVTFSVVCPTVGRPTLGSALSSVARQLLAGDEIIVVSNSDGDFGNAARNSAIERARGTHLIFLDDDDEYLPGALARMRDCVAAYPDRVLSFPLTNGISWEYHQGAIGCVFPNLPGKVGRFGPMDASFLRPLRPGETIEYLSARWGDGEFMRSTLELRGDDVIRFPGAVYVCRPEKSALRRLRYRVRLRTRLRSAVTANLAGVFGEAWMHCVRRSPDDADGDVAGPQPAKDI